MISSLNYIAEVFITGESGAADDVVKMNNNVFFKFIVEATRCQLHCFRVAFLRICKRDSIEIERCASCRLQWLTSVVKKLMKPKRELLKTRTSQQSQSQMQDDYASLNV